MQGLIPYLLSKMIEETAGAEVLQEIKKQADLPPDKRYKMNDNCQNQEWQKLFKATCNVLKVDQEQAEEVFADYFYRDAIKRWPMWFKMATNSKKFLELQPAIHQQLATSVQDPDFTAAGKKKFQIEIHQDEIICNYDSPNHHCHLYKTMARKIIDHYHDQADITGLLCIKDGDSCCKIRIKWFDLK